MSSLAHRTLRSSVRLNPYDTENGQFFDFHSTIPDYYDPLPQAFTEEWGFTNFLPEFNNSASSPAQSADSPLGSPPSNLPDDLDDAPAPPPKSNRRRPADHVPRPRNAFMIFRSEFWAKQKINKNVEVDHRHISRIVGHLWNDLPEDGKMVYRVKAEREKLEHQRLYPGYRFTPTVRTQKPVKRKVQRNGLKDLTRCHKVAGLLKAGKEGKELEKAVMSLDNEEAAEPQPVADHLPCNTHLAPDVRGWVPENGNMKTTAAHDSIPAPCRNFNPQFGELSEHFAPSTSHFPGDALALPPPMLEYASDYSSSLHLPSAYSPSPWDVDPNACFFPSLQEGLPAPVSIEPYEQVVERPMVTALGPFL
ncbi:hypothetical protein B0H15DRAFT_875983 [Mycena belliarum]|uniref:HMG box domain-containing protein n=1 Tax=Mycena belliarum TaxID=1033014 RepID=A0AAD6UKV6_9AGAR|nr:hypothetical protein B0H15DRAFT_875983 [Mycena belliae]